MIRIIATFRVRSDAVKEFRALAGELVEGSRAEDGNLAYDLCVARDDAAIEAHNASAHFTTLVPRMVDLCAEPPSVVQYTEA